MPAIDYLSPRSQLPMQGDSWKPSWSRGISAIYHHLQPTKYAHVVSPCPGAAKAREVLPVGLNPSSATKTQFCATSTIQLLKASF